MAENKDDTKLKRCRPKKAVAAESLDSKIAEEDKLLIAEKPARGRPKNGGKVEKAEPDLLAQEELVAKTSKLTPRKIDKDHQPGKQSKNLKIEADNMPNFDVNVVDMNKIQIKRGRPRKIVLDEETIAKQAYLSPRKVVEDLDIKETPARRGRPPKAVNTESEGKPSSADDQVTSLVNNLSGLSLNNWNVSPDVSYPPEFKPKTLILMPSYDGATGLYSWSGKEYSEADWRGKLHDWGGKYPNIVVKENKSSHTTHETINFRTQQTNNAAIIEWCWESLRITHPNIPTKYKDRFRVDMYGNVISNDASDGSLCKYDVDHLFPWSRGGRSVKSNFAGIQWDANRRLKNDSLIQSLNSRDMQCGLSPVQFKALMEVANVKGGKGNRRDTRFEEDRVIGWLTNGPKKGFALSNFQSIVNRTEDGEVLWRFFDEHEAKQRGDDMTAFT